VLARHFERARLGGGLRRREGLLHPGCGHERVLQGGADLGPLLLDGGELFTERIAGLLLGFDLSADLLDDGRGQAAVALGQAIEIAGVGDASGGGVGIDVGLLEADQLLEQHRGHQGGDADLGAVQASQRLVVAVLFHVPVVAHQVLAARGGGRGAGDRHGEARENDGGRQQLDAVSLACADRTRRTSRAIEGGVEQLGGALLVGHAAHERAQAPVGVAVGLGEQITESGEVEVCRRLAEHVDVGEHRLRLLSGQGALDPAGEHRRDGRGVAVHARRRGHALVGAIELGGGHLHDVVDRAGPDRDRVDVGRRCKVLPQLGDFLVRTHHVVFAGPRLQHVELGLQVGGLQLGEQGVGGGRLGVVVAYDQVALTLLRLGEPGSHLRQLFGAHPDVLGLLGLALAFGGELGEVLEDRRERHGGSMDASRSDG
jgi:hypothetical protein